MADADAGLKHNIGPVVFAAWMDFDEADIPYRIRNGERSLGKKHRQSGNGYCKPKKDRGHPSEATFAGRDAGHS